MEGNILATVTGQKRRNWFPEVIEFGKETVRIYFEIREAEEPHLENSLDQQCGTDASGRMSRNELKTGMACR